jgi:cardiolipin synthase A/B
VTGPGRRAIAALVERFSTESTSYVHAAGVRLLGDPDETFSAILEAIHGARERILLEWYWFAADNAGVRIAQALAARARQGVVVAVLYDAVGSFATPRGFFEQLAGAGVHVFEFHPVNFRLPLWMLNRRDHRKLLSIDGEIAIVGGINLCDENAPASWGGKCWRDAAVEIRGARAVSAFERVFLRTWGRLGGAVLPPVQTGEIRVRESGPLVAALANRLLRERFRIRRAYLKAISSAREFVWIANPYFIPDGNVRRALARAAGRGIDVRVLVPRRSDNVLTDAASRGLQGRLLRRGVKLYAYDGPMLHAKTIVVDGVWSAVGSYNLDNRSLKFNLEVAAAVIDRAFGEALRGAFERDLASARPITYDDWSMRSRWDRVVERCASLFSAYL